MHMAAGLLSLDHIHDAIDKMGRRWAELGPHCDTAWGLIIWPVLAAVESELAHIYTCVSHRPDLISR